MYFRFNILVKTIETKIVQITRHDINADATDPCFGNMEIQLMNAKSVSLRSLVCAIALFGAGQAVAEILTANVGAGILTPISLNKVDDLAFGRFTSSTGGTIVLPPFADPFRMWTAGIVVDFAAPATAAKFTIGGVSGSTFSIALPTTVSLSDGGINTMTVDTFTSNLDLTAETIPVAGTTDLFVGGTLTVGAAQANGTYTGAFDVSVNYN